jgi:hypothetical protein
MQAAAAAAAAGTTAHPGPAFAAGASAGEPFNAELLLMLNEYASEYSHPELHLHPAQVEQDLEDLTAGTAGVLSPRLASMDWQQQQHQQQPRHQQQLSATVSAAVLPGPLLNSHLQPAAVEGAPSYCPGQLHATAPQELAVGAVAASPAVSAPASQHEHSLPTQEL